MLKGNHRLIFFACLFTLMFGNRDLFARYHFPPDRRASNSKLRTRFTVSPLLSFYSINTRHATKPRQRLSGAVSLKGEYRLNTGHTAFFLFGAEYIVHSMSFNSYYFKPDSIQLYTGDMNYRYVLNVHEINIPLQMKLSFTKENNTLFSPYFMIGYHLRTLLFSDLMVSQNGEKVDAKKEKLEFKNPLITSRNNPFVSFTLGLQRNRPNTTKNCLYVELCYRVGFSPYLLKDSFTPSALYINGSHLSFGLGVKF